MPRVVHFEIHADDPERAAKFYRAVFGWQVTKWDGPIDYWMVVTGPRDQPGIDGGIIKRQGPLSGDGVIAYVCTLDVSSVDEYAAKVTAHGGQIVVPKMPIPTVGWMAYAKDTEGNIFGIHQADPNAR